LNERPKHGLDNHVKTDIKEMSYGGVDLIELAQSRGQWRVYVNTAMNESLVP
jgi:hypothetical protein